MTRRGERGSATIWVLACCALLVVVAGAATVRSLAVLARHRAEAGADLAAVAAAGRLGASGAAPCQAAARIAADNGAVLQGCHVRRAPDGRSGRVDVTIVVRVDLPLIGVRTAVAHARAARLAR